MEWGYILFHIACGIAAFFLFVRAWRHEFDVTGADTILFVLLSLLGPMAVVIALVINFFVWFGETKIYNKISNTVLWERRD